MKTGQTKLKSVMADFLINSGLKLTAAASYNHLGNNDGLNLDYYKCFRSKEITKASVIDDIVGNNPVLYPSQEHPDHLVVIKYVPSVVTDNIVTGNCSLLDIVHIDSIVSR